MLQKPKLMILEEALNKRIETFTFSEHYYFTSLGYLGELNFYKRYPINHRFLDLHNICIQQKSAFEVDRLIITSDSIYALDIKSHTGMYYVEGNTWRNKLKSIKSPLTQFENMQQGMQNIINDIGLAHRLVCKMIFINPTFTINQTINGLITYKQLPVFMQQLNEESASTELEHHISSYFEALHQPISIYNLRPQFDFKQVNPGLYCLNCDGKIKISPSNNRYFKCPACMFEQLKSKVIKQALIELEMILYRGFTIKEAHKWVGTPYRNITNRILNKHFTQKGNLFYFSDASTKKLHG